MATSAHMPSGMHLPPASDTRLPLQLASLGTLFALAMIAFISRIFSRVYPYLNLGLDDYAMMVAVALATANWIIIVIIIHITGGRHTVYIPLPRLENAFRLSYFSILIWVWTVTWIKISIALLLLRLKQYSRPWQWGIWTLVACLCTAALASTLTKLFQCTPIRANWKLVLRQSSCWKSETFMNVTYALSSIFVLTDVVCALLPLTFITTMNRPFREKVLLVFLLGLGLLASVCGIIKVLGTKKALLSRDPVWDGADTLIWGYAEIYIGIIGACVPCLKSPLVKAVQSLTGYVTSVRSRGKSQNSSQRTATHDPEAGHGLGSLSSQKTHVEPLGSEGRKKSDEDILLGLGKHEVLGDGSTTASVRRDVHLSPSGT